MRTTMKSLALALCIATVVTTSGCVSSRREARSTSVFRLTNHGTVSGSQVLEAGIERPESPTASSPTDHAPKPVFRLASHATDASGKIENPLPLVSSRVQHNNATVSEVAAPPDFNQPSASMSLDDFESLAYQNNPTLRELAATTQKAAGFRTQVGLLANPIVGYQGQQLADAGTEQHLAFVEQEIVTAGKLDLNRRVLNEALRAQLLEREAQTYRVATDIRVKFYEALAAQKRVELISNFQSVANQGFELAELRRLASEGSKIDVLQAKVQKNEIELAHKQAEVSYAAAWRELAALAGTPDLATVSLRGDLHQSDQPLDWDSMSATLLNASPEHRAAQARVCQALASLTRHGVQAIPNLTVQLGAGVDNGTNSGMMNLQVGAPIPVFNKNQGNIAAARAEYCRASMEVLRIENSIKARLAAVSREFDSSLAAVAKYSGEILPSAEESLELSEIAYKAGETSFIQVLVARRTYFDSNLQFILAQSQLAQARAKVDGYVLTGSLDPVTDRSGDDSLRGLTFSQQ